jgi:hypothetical protein
MIQRSFPRCWLLRFFFPPLAALGFAYIFDQAWVGGKYGGQPIDECGFNYVYADC